MGSEKKGVDVDTFDRKINENTSTDCHQPVDVDRLVIFAAPLSPSIDEQRPIFAIGVGSEPSRCELVVRDDLCFVSPDFNVTEFEFVLSEFLL